MAKGSTLGKDPAVLLYFNDLLGGTMGFTRHQLGCYIHLLGAQFNIGHLPLEKIKNILGPDFGPQWPMLSSKFKNDSNGNFFNERLELEINKRKTYSAGRRKNLEGGDNMESHMGNENGIEDRKLLFKKECENFVEDYGVEMIEDFYAYWTEPNKNKTKFRMEMEKTWDLERRLNTWNKNNFGKRSDKKESKIATTLNSTNGALELLKKQNEANR